MAGNVYSYYKAPDDNIQSRSWTKKYLFIPCNVAFLASRDNAFYNVSMILNCSFCHARYLVPASLFVQGPRRVRCARCSHQWTAHLDAEAEKAEKKDFLDVELAPEAPNPIPPGSNLPTLIKKSLPLWVKRILLITSGAVGLILLLVFIFDRQNIAKHWPSLESFYETVGLHIVHVGENLKIENVRSELRYEDGAMSLVVEGKITNDTKKAQVVPAILASAVGPDGDVMQSWQIDPPAATVGAGSVLPFFSKINAPKGTVIEINLNFVETKDAPP